MDWDPVDRAKALAWKLEEAARCQMCGTAEWEWRENRFAYEPMVKQCQGCYLKDISSEDTHNVPGATITLVPSYAVTNDMREAQMRFLAEAREDHLESTTRGLA